MPRRRRTFPAVLAALAAVAAVALHGAAPARAAAQDRGVVVPGGDPIPLARTGRITDSVGALGGRQGEVRSALDRLDRGGRLQLFVTYVSTFAGRAPQDWANATAVRNGLGRKDVLLAVATHARQYAVSADQGSGLTQTQLNAVSDQAIAPALRADDWAGAAVGAADGYAAALGGRLVTPPAITPGAPDPGAAPVSGTVNGAAVFWIPVAAVAAAAYLGLWAYRRRRPTGPAPRRPVTRGAPVGRGLKRPTPLTPLPELDAQARHLLVATDDAVRTSQEELGFAAAQFGDEAAQPFAEAVDYARGELTAAFRQRQMLDDACPADDDTRREMLDEILSRCTQANRRLDAESDAFDRLRAMEANASQVLERAEAAAAALPGRIAAAEQALAALTGRYSDTAVEPVAGHPAEARDRLEFARTSLAQARTVIASDRGRAVVFVRAAEGALDQAAMLADSVIRREHELRAAEGTLREALAETEADLAEARGLPGGAASGPAAGLQDRIARAEAVLAGVRQESAGRYDPIAALRRVEEAGAELDAAPAGAREREEGERRVRGLLDQALLAARSEVAAARDQVTTNRGAIGSQARTRLAEAERRLRLAESAAPADALEHAREADRLACEARGYARQDVSGFGDLGHGGGRRSGGMSGMGGAVLGGILLGDLLGGGRGGFGGFGGMGGGFGGGPGSFGGGQTRGRMGGGGRF